MAYPTDKETFRRVVNQDLPSVEGDIVDEDDQNLPADFIERLQDTFGYNIKMGFASVKAFFDDIVSKFSTIKEVELLTLNQTSPHALKNPGQSTEYSGNIQGLTTDILFLQAWVMWRQYENDVGKIRLQFRRLNTDIGPSEAVLGMGSQQHLDSTLRFVTSPIADSTIAWRLKLYCIDGQIVWDDICFTCLRIRT